MKYASQTLDVTTPLVKSSAADKSPAAVLGELFKLRLTTLVLLTALVGFYLGSSAPVAWAAAPRPSINSWSASMTPKCAAPRIVPCPLDG